MTPLEIYAGLFFVLVIFKSGGGGKLFAILEIKFWYTKTTFLSQLFV
tara:strand:+ start:1129 stop:1269 length:141 start_codon:yes stop_codon:yes gene_type:complete